MTPCEAPGKEEAETRWSPQGSRWSCPWGQWEQLLPKIREDDGWRMPRRPHHPTSAKSVAPSRAPPRHLRREALLEIRRHFRHRSLVCVSLRTRAFRRGSHNKDRSGPHHPKRRNAGRVLVNGAHGGSPAVARSRGVTSTSSSARESGFTQGAALQLLGERPGSGLKRTRAHPVHPTGHIAIDAQWMSVRRQERVGPPRIAPVENEVHCPPVAS